MKNIDIGKLETQMHAFLKHLDKVILENGNYA